MTSRFPRIGLALGSGGANGLAHIGVLKMLEKNKIPIYCITGSSIGALIGALYAVHGNSQKIEEIAITNSKNHSFGLFDPTLKGGLLKGEKLAQMIHELLNKATFEDIKLPYAAIATDFNSGETIVIKQGKLAHAVRASISIPGILQPVIINNHVLADGGLSEPIPVEAAYELGADIVIAVNLDKLAYEEETVKIPALHSIPWNAVNILRHHLALESVKSADFVITPNIAHRGFIGWNHFFNEDKVRNLIKLGEIAATEIYPQIKSRMEKNKGPKNTFLKILHKIKFYLNQDK